MRNGGLVVPARAFLGQQLGIFEPTLDGPHCLHVTFDCRRKLREEFLPFVAFERRVVQPCEGLGRILFKKRRWESVATDTVENDMIVVNVDVFGRIKQHVEVAFEIRSGLR